MQKMGIESKCRTKTKLIHCGEAGAIGEAELFVGIFNKNIPGLLPEFWIYFDKLANLA